MSDKLRNRQKPHWLLLMRSTASIVVASLVVLVCVTGCTTPYRQFGDIPDNTKLAISPNGNRLFVYWKDYQDKVVGKLLELNGASVVARREIALPPHVMSTAFASNNEQLLVTTLDQGSGELVQIDLATNEQKLIYKSAAVLRFPLEVSEGNYVFLESGARGYSTWQRYQQGQKIELSPQTFGAAASLNVVGDSLFLFTPSNEFLAIHGKVPDQAKNHIDGSTFFIICADTNPLICLRDSIHVVNDKNSYYDGTLTIFNGQQQCDIAGRWVDSRQNGISRDGSTVVFHSAIEKIHGARAIHVVKNSDHECLVTTISIHEK